MANVYTHTHIVCTLLKSSKIGTMIYLFPIPHTQNKQKVNSSKFILKALYVLYSIKVVSSGHFFDV